MKIVKKPHELQKIALKHLLKKDEIGLIATSGSLHKGHISLIEKSCKNDDITIVSIFLFPSSNIQSHCRGESVARNKDCEAAVAVGPRSGSEAPKGRFPLPFPTPNDLQICKSNHVDYVFIPSQEDMFDKDFKTFFGLKDDLIIAAKLFNLSHAHNAYFGMRSFVQMRQVEKMAKDLNFPIKIICCPTVRERSGLAVSEKNSLLSDEQKSLAAQIPKVLKKAAADFRSKTADKVLEAALKEISQIPGLKIEKAEIVDFCDLSPAKPDTKKALFLITFKIGSVRLTDNIELIKARSRKHIP